MQAPSLGRVFWLRWGVQLVVGLVREWWPHAAVAAVVFALGFLLGLAVMDAALWSPL